MSDRHNVRGYGMNWLDEASSLPHDCDTYGLYKDHYHRMSIGDENAVLRDGYFAHLPSGLRVPYGEDHPLQWMSYFRRTLLICARNGTVAVQTNDGYLVLSRTDVVDGVVLSSMFVAVLTSTELKVHNIILNRTDICVHNCTLKPGAFLHRVPVNNHATHAIEIVNGSDTMTFHYCPWMSTFDHQLVRWPEELAFAITVNETDVLTCTPDGAIIIVGPRRKQYHQLSVCMRVKKCAVFEDKSVVFFVIDRLNKDGDVIGSGIVKLQI